MNQENISKKIKEIRKNNNLTQKEFADIFGVTYQAVSKWENGLNIPDISIIKEICNKYEIDINEFLEIKTKEKQKKILLYLIPILILISVLTIITLNDNSFTLKRLTTDCEEFDLLGSVAYNKDKTSINISNVDFCIEEDTKYDEISCVLYEENKNTKIEVSKCNIKNNKNITIDDYLKQLSFMINDYKTSCNSFTESVMYLEINAIKDKKTTTYKVPLTLEDDCTK